MRRAMVMARAAPGMARVPGQAARGQVQTCGARRWWRGAGQAGIAAIPKTAPIRMKRMRYIARSSLAVIRLPLTWALMSFPASVTLVR